MPSLHAFFTCLLHMLLYSLEYDLAPEHKWPIQLQQCLAAYTWLVEQGHTRIFLGQLAHMPGHTLCLALCLARLKIYLHVYMSFQVCMNTYVGYAFVANNNSKRPTSACLQSKATTNHRLHSGGQCRRQPSPHNGHLPTRHTCRPASATGCGGFFSMDQFGYGRLDIQRG